MQKVKAVFCPAPITGASPGLLSCVKPWLPPVMAQRLAKEAGGSILIQPETEGPGGRGLQSRRAPRGLGSVPFGQSASSVLDTCPHALHTQRPFLFLVTPWKACYTPSEKCPLTWHPVPA